MKKKMIVLGLFLVLAAGLNSAMAQIRINIQTYPPVYYAPPAPVYVAPAPVVYVPAPAPPPAPVYVYRGCGPAYYGGPYGHHHPHHHGRGHCR